MPFQIPLALTTGSGLFGLGALFKVGMVWFVINVASKLVYRTLFSLSIGIIVYQGIDLALEPLISLFQDSLNDLPIEVESVIRRCKLPEAMSMLISAGTFKFSLALTKPRLGVRGC